MFKADLIKSLATLIIVLDPTPVDELLFDIFKSEDPPLCASNKRSIEADDVEEQSVLQKTSEGNKELDEDAFGFVFRT